MKALFLSTSSNETDKYMESFRIGVADSELEMYRYDAQEYSDAKTYAAAKAAAPDMIVYVGTRWGPQPSTSTLAQINAKIAPMVHLCSDAADPPWHALLREYHAMGAFAVQVAIDGNDAWPGSQVGMTLLTPIAADHFPGVPLSHKERTVACGYAGNPGNPLSKRRTILTELMMRNLLTMRLRVDGPNSYAEMCAFLANARLSVNIPFSGTEAAMQVKGRVIESGLAGCCLLEAKGAPTSRWFTPGVDYLEYANVGELFQLIEAHGNQPLSRLDTGAMGANLRRRVLAEHSPAVFWRKILERIGK